MRNMSFIGKAILVGLALIVLNVIVFTTLKKRVDLTEDQRYSLSPLTKDIVSEVPDVVLIDVLLDGEFPASFKYLQRAVRDKLERFRDWNNRINFRFDDVNKGDAAQVNKRHQELAEQGINPVRLSIKDQSTERLIYPYAIVRYGGRKVIVNLLEAERAGVPNDVVIHQSVEQLEYKLANALKKVFSDGKKNIVFIQGHGELRPRQTADIRRSLSAYYHSRDINLDSLHMIPSAIDAVVIAKPQTSYSTRDKFLLDQYVMNGGKVMFVVDQMHVAEDSLRQSGSYIATDVSHGLDDLLYKYGLRLAPNIVMDVEASRIPMIVGRVGGENQFELFRWLYYPVIRPDADHPIVKNLDLMQSTYPSTLDTIKTKFAVRKTPLLQTSERSAVAFNPVKIDLGAARTEVDPKLLTAGAQPISYLLEGTFSSLYENRVPKGMKASLEELKTPYKAKSTDTKMVVISDGDFIANTISPSTGKVYENGYNIFENYLFDNKDFFLNAMEYLTDDGNLLSLRGKEMKLRLLDEDKIKSEKSMWRLINIVGPILFMLIFATLYQYVRKKKYS